MSDDRPPHGASPPSLLAAAPLGRGILALTGHFGLAAGEHTVTVRAHREFVAQAAVLPAELGMSPGLIVVPVADGGVVSDAVSSVHLNGDMQVEFTLEPTDVAGLLRAGLSAAPMETRARALAFLLQACTNDCDDLSLDVSQALSSVRNILRERLPPAVIARGQPPTGRVDLLVRIDERTCYVRGWVGYDAPDLDDFTLVSPEGARVSMRTNAFRFPRPDVAEFYEMSRSSADFGFATLCAFDTPSSQVSGWVVEVSTRTGMCFEAPCPPAVEAPASALAHLVGELAIEPLPGQALRVGHLMPAIQRIRQRSAESVRVAREVQFGAPPEDPDVTILVPLYKRIDFVEHQLAQFIHDQDILRADLIYVLDSPELESLLLANAERLARLYWQPFRVAVLSMNGGFSTANNLGVSLARGRLTLLMNSDVLPDQPGWLGTLIRFHDSLKHPGAVGPKLIYEDESIQHAGMYFKRPVGGKLWNNEHYFKGLHRSFGPACVSRPVPAVSAACLLIRTDLYRSIGGLRGMFIQGDFEDSDLCLRLREAGFENWYVADTELYHLEGQSYLTSERWANGEFNRWLHTLLWDDKIDAVMQHHGAPSSSVVS